MSKWALARIHHGRGCDESKKNRGSTYLHSEIQWLGAEAKARVDEAGGLRTEALPCSPCVLLGDMKQVSALRYVSK
mgnify:CR=1 FL=1